MTKINDYLQKYSSKPLPQCINIMEPEFIDYIPGKSLTLSFPVLDIFLNANEVMQGGFIGAAFDNVFGILTFLEKKFTNMSTINMQIDYHRPLVREDRLVITAHLKHKGNTIVSMYAEGFNAEGKLAATASTNIILR